MARSGWNTGRSRGRAWKCVLADDLCSSQGNQYKRVYPAEPDYIILGVGQVEVRCSSGLFENKAHTRNRCCAGTTYGRTKITPPKTFLVPGEVIVFLSFDSCSSEDWRSPTRGKVRALKRQFNSKTFSLKRHWTLADRIHLRCWISMLNMQQAAKWPCLFAMNSQLLGMRYPMLG